MLNRFFSSFSPVKGFDFSPHLIRELLALFKIIEFQAGSEAKAGVTHVRIRVIKNKIHFYINMRTHYKVEGKSIVNRDESRLSFVFERKLKCTRDDLHEGREGNEKKSTFLFLR